MIRPDPNGLNVPRIAVYICHCGSNIAGSVDVEQVASFASDLPHVIIAKTYRFMCSDPGQKLIQQDVQQQQINRVVVAACSPLMHEATFRRVLSGAGLNPFYCHVANIREQVSWVTDTPELATTKAKALIAAAVRRAAHDAPLETKRIDVHPDLLVVGAGIAGIHAALTAADAGKKVYLVERDPSIGGHMAQLDKTFPTLDCSACILTPKMTEVKDHPNIELICDAEVDKVEGHVGNFTVHVRRKPRYVDLDKCTSCGDCVKACPVLRPSQFDLAMSQHAAIYKPFPQAVPSTFVIDKVGRAPCRAACPAHVHAQGYIALILQKKYKEAFELLAQDLPLPTACGRACYHPCEDGCARGELDDPLAINELKRFVTQWAMAHEDQLDVKPRRITHKQRVAIVGGGPAGLACANELSRRGYAVTVFEAAEKAGGMLRYGIPSYRLPEHIIDWDIQRLREHGIEIKTSHPIESIEQLKRQNYQAVFIARGAWRAMKLDVPGEDLPGVTDMLTFLRQAKTGEVNRLTGSVVVVGGGNSTMDAARTAVRLGADEVRVLYRRSEAEMPAHDWEIAEAKAEGVVFQFLTRPLAISRSDDRLSITCQQMQLGEPDDSGRRRPIPIEGSEFELPADLVIPAIGQVAGPKLDAALETDWRGMLQADPITLETAVPGVFAGGDIVSGPATLVEAFAAGKRGAESIDRYVQGVELRAGRDVQPPTAPPPKRNGQPLVPRAVPPRLPVEDARRSFEEVTQTISEQQAIAEAQRCLRCSVCAECLQCVDACQPGAILHDQLERIQQINVGAIILATGYQPFDAKKMPQYGYGRLPNVFTSLEVERMVSASGPTGGHVVGRDGQAPRSVGIIHCVGSRDEKHHEYCSKVCCMYSLKLAHLIKQHTHAEVFNFYIDMRTPGKGYEEFYSRLLKEGVQFVRGRVAEVANWTLSPEEEGKLVIRVEDTLIGVSRRIPVDMVVLSVGLEPHHDVEGVRRIFNIGCSGDGWFLERHPKLAPVSTFSDGIYVAGCCQGPKDIPETVAQAGAAAADAMKLIDRGYVEIEPNTAHIDEDACSGCKTCIPLCPFSAIERDEEKRVARVIEALCKGCGTCVAACPSGAAQQNLFTDEQIYEEIEGLLAYV